MQCKKDASHTLGGLISDFDTGHIYYGSLDLDTLLFGNFSSLSVNDVGNPNNVKYSVLPLTSNPNDDVIYIAAPYNQNKTILSVIGATNGSHPSAIKSISYVAISLRYDTFQNKKVAI